MIYLVAPNATHPSGGVGVAAQWVRLLNDYGHESMFITPNGDPSPYWLNFKVPAGSYSDIQDEPGNKRVDIWMDCAMQFETRQMRHYFFAQDVCQLEHIRKEYGQSRHDDYLERLASGYHLITLTHHAHWYYLYRYGLQSKIVNNWVDTNLFKPGAKDRNAVCMIAHRDHFNHSIAEILKKDGFEVRIAKGSQVEVARTMGECFYFLSDVQGRWDGFEYSEGMPMPILEAMASGCLVFCRDTNGVREFIHPGINGYLYKADAMPEFLTQLLRNMQIGGTSVCRTALDTIQESFVEDRAWRKIKEALEL